MKCFGHVLMRFIVCFLLLYSVPAHALFGSGVKKARQYMQQEKYNEAVELLTERINKKDSDAEAHFLLGLCYLNFDRAAQADDRFECAATISSEYRYKVGQKYRDLAEIALKAGAFKKADGLFEKAIQYEPRVKRHGYRFYVNLGDIANGPSVATFYDKAFKFTEGNETLQREIGYKFLNKASKTSSKKLSAHLKIQASKILGQKEVFGYTLVKNGNTWKVKFYTDQPVTIIERELAGQTINFTGPSSNDPLFLNNPDGSGLSPLPINFPLTKKTDTPLIIKYKNGGEVTLTVLEKH